MAADKDRALKELRRIKKLADIRHITGGGWQIDELLQAIKAKAEKAEKLLNE